MNNTNAENLKLAKNPALYVDLYTEQPDEDIPLTQEDAEIMANIDTKALDKILDYLETQIDNPDAWVSWEEAKKRLRRCF